MSRQYFIAAGTFAAATVPRMTVLPIESGLAFLTFYPGSIGAWHCFAARGQTCFYILLAAAAVLTFSYLPIGLSVMRPLFQR